MHRVSTWSLLALATLSCANPPERQRALKPNSAPAPVVPAAVVQPSMPPTRSELIRRVVPQNVRLVTYVGGKAKRSASGVVVANERTAEGSWSYVVTNAHAVVDAKAGDSVLKVLVDRGPDTDEHVAEPVAVGSVPDLDLALVRVRGPELPAAELAKDEELELGSDVVVVAAPYGRALSLSGGMVSHVEWDKATRMPRMLKTDAAIGYGASGGGIYSLSTGKLLAIVEGYRTAKVGFAVDERDYSFDVPMPGETFAAPVSKLRQFLVSKGYARLLPAHDAPAQAAATGP